METTGISFSQLWRLEVWDQGANTVSFWWDSFLGCRLPPSASSHGRKCEELSGVSFIRALIPFARVLPSQPNYLPKAPSFDTFTSGVRISAYEFQRHVQSIRLRDQAASHAMPFSKLPTTVTRFVSWFPDYISIPVLELETTLNLGFLAEVQPYIYSCQPLSKVWNLLYSGCSVCSDPK